jgi:hypothetical protein
VMVDMVVVPVFRRGSCFSSSCCLDLGAHREAPSSLDVRRWLVSMSLHEPHVTSYCQTERTLRHTQALLNNMDACNCISARGFDRTT